MEEAISDLFYGVGFGSLQQIAGFCKDVLGDLELVVLPSLALREQMPMVVTDWLTY